MLIRNGLVYTENFKFEKMDIVIKDGVILEMREISFCGDNNMDEGNFIFSI